MVKRVSNDSLEVMSNLTLYEKARLVIGNTFWKIHGVDRFQIKDIEIMDGPHGLRKQLGNGDNMGVFNSVSATCFPTAVTMASSWDPNLITEVGIALGEEYLQEGISVLLGPGANIKRSPLCGRNFEYYSEDPFVTGEMAASFIEGVQFVGIGTSLKHFAMNNQEKNRMTIDAFVDERSMREIYLAGFEKAIKRAQPWTVMCAYNQVNGTFASENKRLLTSILRDEWGFDGLTMTDWGASNNRIDGVLAGMDLEMPGPNIDNIHSLVKAVEQGELSVSKLEESVKRVIDLTIKGNNNKRVFTYNKEAHHLLARKVASEGSVLLKNTEQILPLDPSEEVIVMGDFAYKPRYQGAGSSLVNPNTLSIPMKCHPYLDKVVYCRGYDERYESSNHTLIEQAVQLAKSNKKVIILAGLTDSFESEGFDRKHMSMPKSQLELIQSVAEVNRNIIVVLLNGSPIEMPWIDSVKGVLEMYLSGEAMGEAIWDLIYGHVNPSGKLAETFPISYQSMPMSKLFPMGPKGVEYREGLYVGYRYFDAVNKNVLFPFGYGLSYTRFTYSDLEVKQFNEATYAYEVSFTVSNIGNCFGKEITQVYIKPNNPTYYRPIKELKGFKKVAIKPGESERVQIQLDRRSFAHYDPLAKDWVVEAGYFSILIGCSSMELLLEKKLYIDGHTYTESAKEQINKTQSVYKDITQIDEFTRSDFELLYGKKIIHKPSAKKGTFDENSTLEELTQTMVGKTFFNTIKLIMRFSSQQDDKKNDPMIEAMIKELPLRSLAGLSEGRIDRKKIQSILDIANGKVVMGLRDILSTFKKSED